MKKIGILFFFIGILFVLSCATYNKSIIKSELPLSAKQKRTTLVGKWFGELINDKGEIQRWLVDRANDGNYKIEFRIYKNDGRIREQIEVGHWGVSGPIYFSILRGWIKDGKFLPANPEKPYYYDAYQIINLSDKAFTYYNFDTKVKFDVTKVNDDFKWPDKNS